MDGYDEFAIGWNEIFDQEPAEPKKTSVETPRAAAKAASKAKPESRSATKQSSAAPAGNAAFYASEVLTSKKPPVYLRIPGGKRSVIDSGVKEVLMAVPPTQMRKGAEVMEVQLDTIRKTVTEAHSKRRREARQLRRLQRRCRVKDGEDMEALEERYLGGAFLRPLFPDPVESAPTAPAAAPRVPLTKDFFGELGRRRGPSPRGHALGHGGSGSSLAAAGAASLLHEEPKSSR